jgi:DNA-binding NtrC family response regulator/tetratricopeptide (TPR) repeat protein
LFDGVLATLENKANRDSRLSDGTRNMPMFEGIVGCSAQLRCVLEQVAKVAATDSTVLILGETGTGKEMIARAIHKGSKRSSRPFIAVNCAAVPSTLVATELFGHEKGAFTGATQRRLGRFELADGGTIFLDEVGELAADIQSTVLRVLQERQFERVGGSDPVSVDVRILSATNRDLRSAAEAGTFRRDLFYRLEVFPIQMPALRERSDDIPLLTEHFVGRCAGKVGKTFNAIDRKTLELLRDYTWPGNVRELQNMIERAVVLCDDDTFSIDETWLKVDATPEMRRPRVGRLDEAQARQMVEARRMIEAALAETGGRISGPSGAAALLGIPRQTLQSKMASLGIDKNKFRSIDGSNGKSASDLNPSLPPESENDADEPIEKNQELGPSQTTEPATVLPAPTEDLMPHEHAVRAPEIAREPTSRRAKYAITAGALILIAVAGALFWRQRVHSPPKLTDRDILVVADFDNKTGDPVFDAALKQALAFELQQSPFLKAMDEEEIRNTLTRSGRSPDARVTGEVARDVCIREGEKATLEGSIAPIGSHYLIGLQAVNCQTGEIFARQQAEASSKEDVVAALNRSSAAMRQTLGDSLNTVQNSGPAYNQPVTTTSLEALQAFNMGADVWLKRMDQPAAIPYFRRATEIDPNFAQAYAILAIGYSHIGDKAAAADAIGKATALKDHVTEYERLFIEFVSAYLAHDLQKRVGVAALLVRKFPRDPVLHGNLADAYIDAGELEKALSEAKAGLQNGPRILNSYYAVAKVLVELNRLPEASAVLKKAIDNGLDGPGVHERLLYISFPEGDRQAQAREAEWLENNHSRELGLLYQANDAAALGHAKSARALFRKAADLASRHTEGIVFRQQYLNAGPTAEALWGNCSHRSSRQAPVVIALCDPVAAKKFGSEQDENGQTAVEGPEAVARCVALLADGRPQGAAKILSIMIERKAANWGPVYPAAQVLLARADQQMGDTAGARKTYEQFFAFWKDADPDIPILRQARAEYARLK